ncbi:Protein MEI2-like 6 [Hordeum vulgare]|nr:Protein MEI2-like 6 [Hordeum vulgare]
MASAVSRLNPVAPPYLPIPMALAPTTWCYPSSFSYPPPPPPFPPAYECPFAYGGDWCHTGEIPLGMLTFPLQAAYGYPAPLMVYCCTAPPPPPPPQPPAATRCRITEINEDVGEVAAKEEVRDQPSPRSVLTPWSREQPTSPLPPRAPLLRPRPRTSFAGKPRRRQWPRLAFNPNGNNTSLMIRNIPNGFMKGRFMSILDQHCALENAKLGGDGDGDGDGVRSEYDFLYVPVDFGTRFNKGYAFVNMTTAAAARRLHAHLDGHRWEAAGSKKVCDVVHARMEGLDGLVEHFSGSWFPCDGLKEFLPVRFEPPRDGVRWTAEHVVGHLQPRRPC